MKPIFLLLLLMGFLLFGGLWDTAAQETSAGTPIEFNIAGAPRQFAVEQALDLWQTYRYVDGLGGNSVFSIFQDKDGILWFGTDSGVSRFDGVAWMTYTTEDGLAHNYVGSIEQDKDGMIWVRTTIDIYGSSPRASRFDGKQWKTYTIEDGLASDTVNSIFRDRDGVLWFATDKGVSRFDGKDWTSYTTTDGLIDNQVRCIAQDRAGDFWFGMDSGVSHFDGKNWNNYSQKDRLAIASVRVIFQDREGALWFGGGTFPGEGENSVSCFDGKSWTTYTLPLRQVIKILQDRKGGLWFIGGYGDRSGASYFDGRQWKQYTTQDGLGHNMIFDILQDNEGALWFGTGFFYTGDVLESLGGASRFDGKRWANYTDKDGLAGYMTIRVFQDREGILWFGDITAGVSRLDRQSWVRYITHDEKPSEKGTSLVRRVFSIIQAQDGALWFATGGWGIYRYDGKNWTRYTTEEGLAHNDVRCVFQDRDGVLWFGGFIGGLSRFDGTSWMTYGKEDGLAGTGIRSIFQAGDGTLWFGTTGGVSRFDGKSWKTYSPEENGLAGDEVAAVFQDSNGIFWFITTGGISRFDGVNWQTFPQQKCQKIEPWGAIYQDSDGILWFGGENGLSRFDGKTWKTYTTHDGLSGNYITSIAQDQTGHFWIGTLNGGVSRFDGRTFQRLNSEDGLPNDKIGSLSITRAGQIWIGTEDDLVRFVPSKIPPSVSITQILADETTYEHPTGTVMLEKGISRVSFSFRGASFKTLPGRMLYYCQLVGKDSNWQGPTNQESIEYFNLKPGQYTFKVQAVNRDLNYSEPESVHITIPPPIFYKSSTFVLSLSIIGFLLAIAVIGLSIKHWQTKRQLAQKQEEERERLKEEMNEARQMQLSLLPEGNLFLEGYDIAGFSEPAQEVGGDFYDYLQLDDHRFGIVLADVSGKGLQAAMYAVLTNGMLHEVAKTEQLAGQLLSVLNADLCPRMQRLMFTALQLGILSLKEKWLSYANAGQPFPILKRGSEVWELEASGLPLSMMRGVEYNELTVELQTGDFVIFCTDGVSEAMNEAEEMYSFERLEKVIKQADTEISAEEMIHQIVLDVKAHVGDTEQYDDMTIVVVRCLG